jgi:hypothetical protein
MARVSRKFDPKIKQAPKSADALMAEQREEGMRNLAFDIARYEAPFEDKKWKKVDVIDRASELVGYGEHTRRRTIKAVPPKK